MSNQNAALKMKPGITWKEWLQEHGNKLLLFARQQTVNYNDAEDVLQESLIRLVKKINEGVFEGGQESWLPYVYTTIRRCAIDLCRKDSRRKLREEKVEEQKKVEVGEFADPWFEISTHDGDSKKLIEAALRELPEKFVEVIVLRIWSGMTFLEIAETLDESQNTVSSRYRYGLSALKKMLAIARKKGDLLI